MPNGHDDEPTTRPLTREERREQNEQIARASVIRLKRLLREMDAARAAKRASDGTQ